MRISSDSVDENQASADVGQICNCNTFLSQDLTYQVNEGKHDGALLLLKGNSLNLKIKL